MRNCFHVNAFDTLTDFLGNNPDVADIEFSYIANDMRKFRKTGFESVDTSCILEKKHESGASYWQTLLGREPQILLDEEDAMEGAAFHNGPGTLRKRISRIDFLRNGRVILAPTSGTSLNFLSIVNLKSGARGFVPLIDFRLPHSERNDRIISAICETLMDKVGTSWGIVRSENSYHGYSMSTLSFSGYASTLGWALLFDPLVDGRHIGHQLIDGCGALRVL